MTRSGSGSLRLYIMQRALLVIPMIWVILTLVFIVLRVAPGDPVSAALGGKLDEAALEQRREALGFNEPLIAQYWDYLSSVMQLDFGTTFSDNQPVLRVVRDNGGATLSLTLSAFMVALVIGIPLGLLAGRFRDSAGDVSIRHVRDPQLRRTGLLRRFPACRCTSRRRWACRLGGMASPITVFTVAAGDPHPPHRRLPQRGHDRHQGRARAPAAAGGDAGSARLRRVHPAGARQHPADHAVRLRRGRRGAGHRPPQGDPQARLPQRPGAR